MHVYLAIAIFVLTIGLILLRPCGISEAWATTIGGTLMLALGLETVSQAFRTVEKGGEVLLFLLGLLLLSNLLSDSGFFEWSALHAIRASKGSGKSLFRNTFILGAVTTALLSLDTTAVILTPLVLAFIARLKLNSRPFLLACAFTANTGSLLLPVSNLTNLLFVSAFHWEFRQFTLTMLLPQMLVLLTNYFLFKSLFAKEIPDAFKADEIPEPSTVIPSTLFFLGSIGTLIFVLVGYFVGSYLHVAPFVIVLTGASALLIWGLFLRQIGWKVIREISWSLFPFVIGLFVVIQGVENVGLTSLAERTITNGDHSALVQALRSCFVTAIGSNVINNIPMALLSISSLDHGSSEISRYGALIGCNLGPNLTVTGSLATMLVISSARRHGDNIGPLDFFKAGLVTTPILLFVAAVALWLYFQIP